MKCSYCGSDIEKGRVFCLNCGEEVQWVPEFDPISSYRDTTENQNIFPKDVQIQHNDEEKYDKISESDKKKSQKRKNPFVLGVLILLLILIALLSVKGILDYKNHNSFEYQYNMAETYYSNSDYETALEFIDRAVVLMPESINAKLLKSQILYKCGDSDASKTLLLALIKEAPDNVTAYALLVDLYEKESDYDSIKRLLLNTENEKVKNRFRLYFPVEVLCSQIPGHYEDLITVELFIDSEQKCNIYYTLDGTDPMLMRNLYKTGIVLEEGTTSIRAVAVNEKNIVGDVKSYTYEIELPLPDVPEITPVSGEYDEETKLPITVQVPEGCKAYYEFDEKPTLESNQYTHPVDMPAGEHTFYVMLVNEYGKESHPGSATYVLKEGDLFNNIKE